MSDDGLPPDNKLLGDLLVSYDEALAEGRLPPTGTAAETMPECSKRLNRGRACVNLLRKVFRPPGNQVAPEFLLLAGYRSSTEPIPFGRFRIRRELGRGGFGVVYLADDPKLGRSIALKLPRPETLINAQLRERFLREARAAASLDHPNLVTVHEAGEVGPICYIASAYCPGANLAVWLQQQSTPMKPERAALLLARLAGAVQHAHANGVLHRDIKPSNILLTPSPTEDVQDELGFVPRLTDFGLAKILELDSHETSTGAILGTPHYMAPEQAQGWFAGIGPQTDVYSLGVILYEILGGQLPFRGPSLLATLEQIRASEPAPLRSLGREVPASLETICMKCLRKDPQQRYATAGALADDLGRFLRHEPVQAHPLGMLGKLALWTEQPARIRDAGMLSFLIAASSAVTIAQVGAFAALGFPPGVRFWAVIRGSFPMLILGSLPTYLIGKYTFRRNPLALWAGAVHPIFFSCAVYLVGIGKIDTGNYYSFGDVGLQANMLTLVIILQMLEFLSFLFALRAFYANRHVPGFIPSA
jgi:hypothetical protein